MQIKYKLNHSLFIFGLMILLFVTSCLFVQAQNSPNDITFHWSNSNFDNAEIDTMKADSSNQISLTSNATGDDLL